MTSAFVEHLAIAIFVTGDLFSENALNRQFEPKFDIIYY